MPTLSPFAAQVLDAVAETQAPVKPSGVVATSADAVAFTLRKPTSSVARALNRLEAAGLVRAVALPGLTVPGYVPVEEEPVEARPTTPPLTLAQRRILDALTATPQTAADLKKALPGAAPVGTLRAVLEDLAARGEAVATWTTGDNGRPVATYALPGAPAKPAPAEPGPFERFTPGTRVLAYVAGNPQGNYGRVVEVQGTPADPNGALVLVETPSGDRLLVAPSALAKVPVPKKPAPGTDAARTASLLEEFEGRILPARRQSLQEAQEAHREAIRQHEDLKADVEALRAVLRRLEAQETEALEARKRAETAVADLRADVRDATEKVEALRRGDAS
ncbi:hypothetical protein [Cellulosimicrobium sp. TH-20]|uniref:hypothetical protein n=1 Tax=Cellulosimicrobium sp. TH-20 TaxID=1980001 RepID=UPI00119F3533|nr:hypothetical protein [Cellulosimicrobium sp. TH-20]